MTTLFEPAFAKINLTLDVLSKRQDGYHDLQSIMQTVSLQDDIIIQIETGKPWALTCNKDGIPCDRRNLAWKAAEVFLSAAEKNPDGISIHIEKRIPSEAGLGGGSSDAAAVLRALNRHYDYPFSITALAELGSLVGSDVPFCVQKGTAMAEGRGERLRMLPDMPKNCWIIICKPEFSVSTPALYKKIDEVEISVRPDHGVVEDALRCGDLKKLSQNVYNVFEPLVSAEHPELDAIKVICRKHGALGVQMTGSGSAVFAITAEENTAEAICASLKRDNLFTFIAKPV